MPTFQPAGADIVQLASAILCEFASHKPLLDARVRVDYVMAFADIGKDGHPKNFALMHHGVRAYGLARLIGLKDRVMGRGDAEISLDGDFWAKGRPEIQRALLDHELHHLEPKLKNGGFVRDDIGRPELILRRHDFQFGWFTTIAQRHGAFSMERLQAKTIVDAAGQYYFPELAKFAISSNKFRIEVDLDRNCEQCGKPGATQNGMCLKCLSKKVKEHAV
jgi:hypothetical protein